MELIPLKMMCLIGSWMLGYALPDLFTTKEVTPPSNNVWASIAVTLITTYLLFK